MKESVYGGTNRLISAPGLRNVYIDENKHKIFISVFNQLDARNLFHNKFYFMPPHFSSTCAPIGVMIPEAV